MAPLVSHLLNLGQIEAGAVRQLETFAAGMKFAQAEGIIPAPKSAHAVAQGIREALRCREEGVSRAILIGLSGHGHFNMQAHLDYSAGKLQNYQYPAEEVAMALAGLPAVGVPSEG